MTMNSNTLCGCGHKLEDHHNPMVCDGIVYGNDGNQVKFDPFVHKRYEVASVQTSWYCLDNRTDFPHLHGEECEYWGFNETGGLKPVDIKGKECEWIRVESELTFNSFELDGEIDHWEDHCGGFQLPKGEESE